MRPKRNAALQARLRSTDLDTDGHSENEKEEAIPESPSSEERPVTPRRVYTPRRRGRPPKRATRTIAGLLDIGEWREVCQGSKWVTVVEEKNIKEEWISTIPMMEHVSNNVEIAAKFNVHIDDEHVHHVCVGPGGISALDAASDLLAVATFPYYGFRDHWTMTNEEHCSPIQLYRYTTQKTAPNVSSAHVATITHQFGLVRSLRWCPHSRNTLLALFGDGKVRVWSVPDHPVGTYSLENSILIGDDEYVITGVEWCPSIRGRIATGTANGLVLLWRIHNDRVECIAGLQSSKRPVTSVAFHSSDAMLLAIGVHDSPSLLIDLRRPHNPQTLLSTLALVPLVRWSPLNDVWILADSDGGVRALPSDSLVDRQTVPAGTFNAALLDVQVSPFHSIVAMAGVEGTVHLVRLDPRRRQLFEEQVLQVVSVTPDTVKISMRVVQPKLHKGPVSLPDYSRTISCLSWSKSPTSPGLLMVGLCSIGILFLFPIDNRL
ncbi:hypothetical protein PSACC_01548 [Paramicrosporidium saccamoebae]|uniref:Uncharacterized protein n=1 Tax=Paramicrosporidium saccamoebae TaxID=1246581 RepID=A0A2H9TLH2_9FUNG|nr:hypothetical protein PSACC_01548 [Paramicrosporidium saccamoebae]